MLNALGRYWWIVALRGLGSVSFGLLALLWPGLTLAGLVIFFGAYSAANGVMALAFAVQNRERWLAHTLEGIAGISAGVVAVMWPGLTAFALLYLIAAWAVVTGALSIMAAIRLRKVIPNETLLGLSGLASLAFGVLLMTRPGAGVLAMTWLISSYALVFGFLLIALAFRLRSQRQRLPPATLIPTHDLLQEGYHVR